MGFIALNGQWIFFLFLFVKHIEKLYVIKKHSTHRDDSDSEERLDFHCFIHSQIFYMGTCKILVLNLEVALV